MRKRIHKSIPTSSRKLSGFYGLVPGFFIFVPATFVSHQLIISLSFLAGIAFAIIFCYFVLPYLKMPTTKLSEQLFAERLSLHNADLQAEIEMRKETELALKDSEEQYRMLADLTFEGIVIHREGAIIDMNKALVEIGGYTKEDLIGKKLLDQFIIPRYKKLIIENFQKEHIEPFVIEISRKDETIIPVEIEPRRFKYKGETLYVTAIRDLNSRNLIQETLKSALNINQMTNICTAQDIIRLGLEEAVRLTKSEIGYFHFVNQDQETISLNAWSDNTLKKCNITEKAEHYPISKAGIWADCFRTREPVIHNNYETTEHKKGLPEGHFPLHSHMSLPVFEKDHIVAIIGVGNKTADYKSIDIDVVSLLAEHIWSVYQRKKSAEALEKSENDLREINATKDRFFSIISHDLRSPLGNTLTLTYLLKDNYDTYSNIEKYNMVGMINQSADVAFKLVENLLIWSRTQTGKIQFQPEKINLLEIVQEVISLLAGVAGKKEIDIVNTLPDSLNLTADKNMISTVIRNLISNAIKFSPRESKIQLIAKQDALETVFVVIDEGIGMNETQMADIFRIDRNTSTHGTENEPGTGLGLLLCKEFIEKHKGKIWIESTENKGSSIYFSIPF